jgi:hypothetical protein
MGLYEKFKELVFGKQLTAQTGTLRTSQAGIQNSPDMEEMLRLKKEVLDLKKKVNESNKAKPKPKKVVKSTKRSGKVKDVPVKSSFTKVQDLPDFLDVPGQKKASNLVKKKTELTAKQRTEMENVRKFMATHEKMKKDRIVKEAVNLSSSCLLSPAVQASLDNKLYPKVPKGGAGRGR